MARKRITQMFPFLTPIRSLQKRLFCQIEMFFDKNIYSKHIGDILPFEISNSKTLMINKESGHDIVYQKNKVDNLKIISKTMNNLYIYPNETFSFYYLSRKYKKYGKLKKGLVCVNGKIVHQKGGGTCHLSNILYYTFLKSPLTIVERYGHKVKSFPNPDKNSLDGVDATISDGFLDLKVRNDTNNIYQININFDDEYLYVKLLSNKDSNNYYVIKNENIKYFRKANKVFESLEVIKQTLDKETDKIIETTKLYDEILEIEYKLPNDIKLEVVE